MDITLDLLQKHTGSGPRYTSYPTAVEMHPDIKNVEWEKSLLAYRKELDPTVSLYLHVPFCRSLCYFCGCHKVITEKRTVVGPFIQAVQAELAAYQKLLGRDLELTQLHWGGGSPNFLTGDEATEIYQTIRQTFPRISPSVEQSIELDPRTTKLEFLQLLRSLGFNRASLGVQDFDADVQKAINRIQSFEITRDLIVRARELGFASINVDLIYGLPQQTVKKFRPTIEKVIDLKPDRLALYAYAHVPWLKKTQNTFRHLHVPPPQERIALFIEAITLLEEAGYQHIGMDHFALPNDSLAIAASQGKLARNFMGYTIEPSNRLIALGPSSISSLPRAMVQNVKDQTKYEADTMRQGFAIERGLLKSDEDLLREDVIQQLFCRGLIDIPETQAKWKIDFRLHFSDIFPALNDFIKDELVTISDTGIQLTKLGKFFVRNVAMLFDAYLKETQSQQRPVFSQTI